MDGSDELNELTNKVIGAAIRVHAALGPGLLELAYRRCLEYELRQLGLKVESEVWVTLNYGELTIHEAYRIDLLVNGVLVLEIKAVEKVLPVHHAQLLTYLKLAAKPVGLFFNFNSRRLPDDMKRMVNRV